MHVYEIRPRKDHRGVDLISDALPFGRLWYGEPNAVSNAIEYAKFRSRSPAHRKSRAKQRADKIVVVHTPDPRLLKKTTPPLEHKVWVSVAVEIAHPNHSPSHRKSRAIQRADKIVVVHVPDPRLLRTRKVLEHKVWVSVAVEIAHPNHSPVRRKSRAKGAPDKDVVVHVPDPRLLRKAPEQIVWLAVTVEIGHPYDEPAHRKSRAKQRADKDVVVHVPDPRLLRKTVGQHIVWLVIAVEIAHRHQVRYGHAPTKQSQRQCRAGEENQSESSGQIISGLCKVHFHFLVAP